MPEQSPQFDRIRNIWAPWRMEYIESLDAAGESGCFLCDSFGDCDGDEGNLVLWRGRRCLTVLNRFPYTGGHALVAPNEHVPDMAALDGAAMLEMMEMVRDLQSVMTEALGAQGFNVGINVGRCAGAGLPGHLHVHVVPRWAGDTNFMSVFGDVRVIPVSLDAVYSQMRQAGRRLGLPKLSSSPG